MRWFPKLVLIGLFLAGGVTPAYSAITFIATSTDVSAFGDNTVEPAEPTGTAEDDIVVANCTIWTEDGSWGDPADFTQIDVQTLGVGTQHAYIGYKVRGSDEGNGYEFTHSGTNVNQRCSLTTYRGVDTSTPIDVTYASGSHYDEALNDANEANSAITTVTDGAWVILLYGTHGSDFSSMGAPSGYTLRESNYTDSNNHTATASKEVASAGGETPGVWTHSADDTQDPQKFTIALRPAATGPSFTSGPSAAAATNGYTISGTISGSGTLTVYAVACPPAESTPTANQIEAGDCGSGSDAQIAANEVWTTGMADSFALTEASNPPRYDVYVSGSDGTNDTSVSSFANEDRSDNTDQNTVALTSVASDSVFALQTVTGCDTTSGSATVTGCSGTEWLDRGMAVDLSAGFADLTDVRVLAVTTTTITFEADANAASSNIAVTQDAYYSATVAASDVVEIDDDTSLGEAVTLGVDGSISFTDANAGAYRTIGYCIEDVSDATDALFATPGACFGTNDKFYIFDESPEWDDFGDTPLVIRADEAMPSIDLTDNCTHVNGHTLTFTNRAGNTHSGLTLASNGTLSGDPDAEDESGTTYDILCENQGQLGLAIDKTVYIVDEWTVGDYDANDQDDVDAAYYGDAAWAQGLGLSVTKNGVCSDSEAAGEVIDGSQSPSASAEANYDAEVSVNISLGSCGSVGSSRSGVNISNLPIGL